jgi:hypothetical protein
VAVGIVEISSNHRIVLPRVKGEEQLKFRLPDLLSILADSFVAQKEAAGVLTQAIAVPADADDIRNVSIPHSGVGREVIEHF